jgi:hypothetical protein
MYEYIKKNQIGANSFEYYDKSRILCSFDLSLIWLGRCGNRNQGIFYTFFLS